MTRNTEILKELEEVSPLLATIKVADPFVIPEGYFDAVTGTVMISIKNDVAPSGPVPGEYFETLAENILSKIEGTAAHELSLISPLVAGIPKSNPFAVPERYFDKLAEEVVITEKDYKAHILEGINKPGPYEVPGNYFEHLPGAVLQKIIPAQAGAKIITMGSRKIWKYAVAAVFTGIIALGIFKYSSTGAGSMETAITPMSEPQINQALENLPEEDIIQYLEKNGTTEDLAALSSGIDEKSLPDQEDYFTDETTLDNFLEEVELKN